METKTNHRGGASHMINDLIEQIVSRLGLGRDQAEQGTGVLFALLERFGDSDIVRNLFDRLPGAADLAGAQRETAQGGGGGLMGAIGDMLGGQADAVTDVMGAFQSTGLSLDQARDLIPLVTNFAREQAGPEIVEQVMENVPWLRELAG